MSFAPEGYLLFGILILDVVWGDPVYSLHPVRLIGLACEKLEKLLRSLNGSGRLGGVLLCLLMVLGAALMWKVVHSALSYFHFSLAVIWELYSGWSLLAGRDLIEHARRVWNAVEKQDLQECREMTGMMVGRDTDSMDFSASGRAVVESLSENLNDGMIAPLFYFILFGIPGMLVYKVVNTLDSMVGYRNPRYLQFGWASARLDDLLNWLPARLTWMLISIAAVLHPQCCGRKAFSVGWNHHHGVSSPNAGWCEATADGALRARLCGPIWREGKLASQDWLGPLHFREGGTVKDMRHTAELTVMATFLFGVCGLILLQLHGLPIWEVG